MQITSQELQQLAAAEAPRLDMYAGIHKALRSAMADALVTLGRMDPEDATEVGATCERVRQLLALCASHLAHENTFVHAAIEARSPGASAAIADEHQEHESHIRQLGDLVAVLEGVAPPARAGAAGRLYSALSLFIAENFAHMHVEETAHNAVLWARYTDAELVAIHDALVASIPPQEMMAVARWLVPALNPVERFHLLADIRAKAPAPAFEAILQTVRPHLSGREWERLARALELAPAA